MTDASSLQQRKESDKNAVIPHLVNMVDTASHVIFPMNPGSGLIILLHAFLWKATKNFVIQGDVFFPIPNIYICIYTPRDGWMVYSLVSQKFNNQTWAFWKNINCF